MEEIRQQLLASRVIGGVLDDFHPLKKFYPVYGLRQIDLGDVVSPADVQRGPEFLDHDDDDNDPTSQEIFENSTFVMVMTEPNPDDPSIQYLNWLVTDVTATEHDDDSIEQCLFTYEPPKPMDTCMMVFTVFKQNASQSITKPSLRENFSTRDFAHTNGLGPPLSAGFFYVKNDNQNGGMESSTGSTTRCKTRKRKKFKKC